MSSDLLRPRDVDALRAELRLIVDASQVPVVFGGEVDSDTLHLSEFRGTRTRGLEGLAIAPMSGLGGRVMDQGRPAAVSDYGASMSITHHFDRPVLSEGLRSILAVPVVVGGITRVVMYAAARRRGPIGDRVADAVAGASRRLGREIAVRDEVDRRVRMMAISSAATEPQAELQSIREELADLSRTVGDDSIRARIDSINSRLVSSMGQNPVVNEFAERLSPRELDVVHHIALGCTNTEVAQQLSIGTETVKSYLRSVMRKTGTHTRYQAVLACRTRGLLQR